MPTSSVRHRPVITIMSAASTAMAPVTGIRMATITTIITTKRCDDDVAGALRFLSHGRLERGQYAAARTRQHLVLPSPAESRPADGNRARESTDALRRLSPS